jgi:hypothetical protein
LPSLGLVLTLQTSPSLISPPLISNMIVTILKSWPLTYSSYCLATGLSGAFASELPAISSFNIFFTSLKFSFPFITKSLILYSSFGSFLILDAWAFYS